MVAAGMSLVMTSQLALGCSTETAQEEQSNLGTSATSLERSLEAVVPIAHALRNAATKADRSQIVETRIDSDEDLTVLLKNARVRVYTDGSLRALRFQFDDEPSVSQNELEALVQRDPARAVQFSLVRLALADRTVSAHESVKQIGGSAGLRPKLAWIPILIGISIVLQVVAITLPYVYPPNPCGSGPMPSNLTVATGTCCTASLTVQVCSDGRGGFVEAGTSTPVSTACTPQPSCYETPALQPIEMPVGNDGDDSDMSGSGGQ